MSAIPYLLHSAAHCSRPHLVRMVRPTVSTIDSHSVLYCYCNLLLQSSRDLMKLGEELLQRAMREMRKCPKPSASSDTLAEKSGRPRLLAALSAMHRALINRQLRVSVHQSKKDTPSPDASPLMVRLTISLLDPLSVSRIIS